ncbi:MAG TPA: ATP-binding cassette domain-containing protein, partial [Stellaceae bacterium]|nr:ATP-binding cassette domain-containing protein [Stellaceae bacterium]
MLDVSGLTLSYGAEPVLEGADLRVDTGQFVSLVGPSGSGKSSLLRAIMGLQRPSAGTVSLGLDQVDLGILFQTTHCCRGVPPSTMWLSACVSAASRGRTAATRP